MPNLFRTLDGHLRKPGEEIPFARADGTVVIGVWTGSAQDEKLAWWLRPAGNELVQSECVTAVASKADDDGELIWGDAPADARLFFILEAAELGKNYRRAKMVTTDATPAQLAYFRHDRAALFGHFKPDGSLAKIPPLVPPPPLPKAQGELF